MMEELDNCDFCLQKGRKRNLARVTWLYNNDQDEFCPHCLPGVVEDMRKTPWVKKYGYTVDYPYRK
jgi:hypothetical protein